MRRLMCVVSFVLIVLMSIGLPVLAAQNAPIPLRVEAAATGELTAAAPTALYSFNVFQSTRMGFYFDITDGDMAVTLVVFDQDGTTVLGGSSGSNNNGVVINFPSQGDYSLALQGENGESAAYRLMIDADPALPINTFVVTSYVARGSSSRCDEDVPAPGLHPDEDLNVCFALALIEDEVEVTAQWWSPNGELVSEESNLFSEGFNFVLALTGIIYNGENPFSEGWWQVNILINGELSYIQWLWVSETV